MLVPRRPPRVLQIITDSFSAAEFVAPLVRYAAARGIESVIACSGGCWTDAHSFVEPLRSQHFDVREVAMPRQIAPIADLTAFWSLNRLLRSERFDLVHTHLATAGILGRLAAKLQGLPVVHSVHDYAFVEATGSSRMLYYLAERLTASLSDRMLFVSEHERQISIARRIGRPDRLLTTGWGVQIDRYTPAEAVSARSSAIARRYGLPPEALVLGTVARLIPRKGIDILLRAMAILAPRFSTLHLLIVGGGPLHAPLARLVAELGLNGRVTFTGFIDDPDEMPALYASMDIFCLPTRREGYGMAVAEAAAMGKPVIASDIPPVNSLVVPGVTGLLVPVDRPAALAAAVAQLLEDEPRRRAMGAQGRRFA
ncbi:MAG: glycosyltransferase family 4 protein, partial [Dehalococcoidia bacterium]